jgi:hypothetical protein
MTDWNAVLASPLVPYKLLSPRTKRSMLGKLSRRIYEQGLDGTAKMLQESGGLQRTHLGEMTTTTEMVEVRPIRRAHL